MNVRVLKRLFEESFSKEEKEYSQLLFKSGAKILKYTDTPHARVALPRQPWESSPCEESVILHQCFCSSCRVEVSDTAFTKEFKIKTVIW